jgi:hypothetical protein
MKTIILLTIFLASQIFAQDITILKPNQSFSSKDSVAIVTLPRLVRIDSVVKAYQAKIAAYQKDSVVYVKGMALSDSITKKLLLVQQKDNLLVAKDSLLLGVDSLLKVNIKIYQGVVTDLQNTVGKDKGSSGGFFNNTFWFGTGAIVGVIVVYISSEILNHIK